jgi:hypothetical protein
MRARTFFALLLLSLMPLPDALAADAAVPDTASGSTEQIPPADSRKTWSVAFTAFSVESLPAERRYFAYSIPLLLRDRLSGLTTHTFSPAERDLYRSLVISKELAPIYKSLQQQRSARDEAALAAGGASAAQEKQLATLLSRIRWLESLDPSVIDVAEEKPLAFKDGTAAGKLFDAPLYSFYQYAMDKDVDLLVGGTVTEIEGYLLVDLWAFAPAREAVVYSYREAAGPEEIYSSLDAAVKGLTGVVLGRDWSALSVNPDPPNSVVVIDGVSMGAGKVNAAYLAPGSREIKVTAPGYAPDTRTVELAPFAEKTIDVSLVKQERPMMTISSTPPGADVYLDSVWKGKTPLSMETPAEQSRIQLGLGGYYDLPLSIGPDSAPALSLVMEPDTGSRTAVQDKARDDFYFAFGFFALSLPIPFFCNSSYLDSRAELDRLMAFPADTSAAQARVILVGNVSFYSYLGSTAISASLFTWMIVNLVRYIMVVDKTAG